LERINLEEKDIQDGLNKVIKEKSTSILELNERITELRI
jgi:hypothetical protein